MARIANRRTRAAYPRAVGQFLAWCQVRRLSLETVSPLHVAAYIRPHCGSAPTVKQHLAAIRILCDWLVVSQVLAVNPAAAVRGPKHIVTSGNLGGRPGENTNGGTRRPAEANTRAPLGWRTDGRNPTEPQGATRTTNRGTQRHRPSQTRGGERTNHGRGLGRRTMEWGASSPPAGGRTPEPRFAATVHDPAASCECWPDRRKTHKRAPDRPEPGAAQDGAGEPGRQRESS